MNCGQVDGFADVGWDIWAHAALGHVVAHALCQLGRVHMAESGATKVSGGMQASCSPGSVPAEYHFCHILLVKVRHKTQQEVEINFIS